MMCKNYTIISRTVGMFQKQNGRFKRPSEYSIRISLLSYTPNVKPFGNTAPFFTTTIPSLTV